MKSNLRHFAVIFLVACAGSSSLGATSSTNVLFQKKGEPTEGLAKAPGAAILLEKTLPSGRKIYAETLPVTTNEFVAEWKGKISLRLLSNFCWIRVQLLIGGGETTTLWRLMSCETTVFDVQPEPVVFPGTGWRILDVDYDESQGRLLVVRQVPAVGDALIEAVKCPPFPGTEFRIATNGFPLQGSAVRSARITREASKVQVRFGCRDGPERVFELRSQRWVELEEPAKQRLGEPVERTK
jgi:hypothetical protein